MQRQSERDVGSIDKRDRVHDQGDGNDAEPADGDSGGVAFVAAELLWCGDHIAELPRLLFSDFAAG